MNKDRIHNFLILLVLLASLQLISHSDPFSQILSIFVIISSIIFWIRKNIFESILGGALLTFILDLIWCRFNNMHNKNEHFENIDLSDLNSIISTLEKNPNKDTLDSKDFKNIDNGPTNKTEKKDDINSYTKNMPDLEDIINTKNKKNETDDEEHVNTLTSEDILHIEKDDDDDDQYSKNSKKKVKETDNYKPHEAQRETYRIINTVKQLKDTIDSLTPTIKSGQHILKMLEKFQL